LQRVDDQRRQRAVWQPADGVAANIDPVEPGEARQALGQGLQAVVGEVQRAQRRQVNQRVRVGIGAVADEHVRQRRQRKAEGAGGQVELLGSFVTGLFDALAHQRRGREGVHGGDPDGGRRR
jgi:hypothetical protein